MTSTSPYNIARAIYESSLDKDPGEQKIVLEHATALIAQKHMLSKSEEILSQLEKIVDKENGVIRAKISTAKKLSKKDHDSIEKIIMDRYKVKEVELVIHEDSSLLDGVVIEVGDERLDMSLSHKVNQLQAYLLKN
jgi:F0F1-type ATP synthase delta subunit